MATPIISDHIQVIDKPKTNRLTKNVFIARYLADFKKQGHRPHYSDKFVSACEVIKFYKNQPTLNPIHDALMHMHALAQGGV